MNCPLFKPRKTTISFTCLIRLIFQGYRCLLGLAIPLLKITHSVTLKGLFIWIENKIITKYTNFWNWEHNEHPILQNDPRMIKWFKFFRWKKNEENLTALDNGLNDTIENHVWYFLSKTTFKGYCDNPFNIIDNNKSSRVGPMKLWNRKPHEFK